MVQPGSRYDGGGANSRSAHHVPRRVPLTSFDLDLSKYDLGWSDSDVEYAFAPEKGINPGVVEQISWWKGEPRWMAVHPSGQHLYLSYSNRDHDNTVVEVEMAGDELVAEEHVVLAIRAVDDEPREFADVVGGRSPKCR